LQFVDVLEEVVLPQSLATALRRADTVLLVLEAVDLKYVESLVPAEAALEAAEASLWQLERAVRTADSFDPVQLEPMTVRLAIALVTVAARAPSTFIASLFDS
jgi:hypothetical protein